MTTQSEITQTPNDRLLHHNARNDAWVTSQSMIHMVETRATELGMSILNGVMQVRNYKISRVYGAIGKGLRDVLTSRRTSGTWRCSFARLRRAILLA